jgi:hypothetical protein
MRLLCNAAGRCGVCDNPWTRLLEDAMCDGEAEDTRKCALIDSYGCC